MSKIFISYARQDRAYVDRLAQEITGAGHDVLYDENVLLPGMKFQEVLDNALRTSDFFVMVISQSYMSSQSANLEFGIANHLASIGRMTLFPILIDDVKPPFDIAQFLYIQDTERNVTEAVNKLLIAISRYNQRRMETVEQLAKAEADLSLFVDEALRQQMEYRDSNKTTGERWNLAGVGFLVMGLVGTAIIALDGIQNGAELTMVKALSLVALDIVSIGVLAALAKFSYSLGNSYMAESLKCADRMHAIHFGKFYLKAFGAKLSPTEVKEAFQHWNVDRSSTFSSLDAANIDPQIIALIGRLVTSAVGNKEKG